MKVTDIIKTVNDGENVAIVEPREAEDCELGVIEYGECELFGDNGCRGCEHLTTETTAWSLFEGKAEDVPIKLAGKQVKKICAMFTETKVRRNSKPYIQIEVKA